MTENASSSSEDLQRLLDIVVAATTTCFAHERTSLAEERAHRMAQTVTTTIVGGKGRPSITYHERAADTIWFLFDTDYHDSDDEDYVPVDNMMLGDQPQVPQALNDPFAAFCSANDDPDIENPGGPHLFQSFCLDNSGSDDDPSSHQSDFDSSPERIRETILLFLLVTPPSATLRNGILAQLAAVQLSFETAQVRIGTYRARMEQDAKFLEYFERLRDVVLGTALVCGKAVVDVASQLRFRLSRCRFVDVVNLVGDCLGVRGVEGILGRDEESSKESYVELVVDAFVCGSVSLSRRVEEWRIIGEGLDQRRRVFSLFGVDVPRDVLVYVLSFLEFGPDIVLGVGSVSFEWYALVLSTWSACVHVRKANLFSIPLLVLGSMKQAVLHLGETKRDILSIHEMRYFLSHSCLQLRDLFIDAEDPMQFRAFCTLLSTSPNFAPGLRKLEFVLDDWIFENEQLLLPTLDLGAVFPSLQSVSCCPVVEWCGNCGVLSEVRWFFSGSGTPLSLPIPMEGIPIVHLDFDPGWDKQYDPQLPLLCAERLVAVDCARSIRSLTISSAESLCVSLLERGCVQGTTFPVLEELHFDDRGGNSPQISLRQVDFSRFVTPRLLRFSDTTVEKRCRFAVSRLHHCSSLRSLVLGVDSWGGLQTLEISTIVRESLRLHELVLAVGPCVVTLLRCVDDVTFRFPSLCGLVDENVPSNTLVEIVTSTLCLEETSSCITFHLGVGHNDPLEFRMPTVFAGFKRRTTEETEETEEGDTCSENLPSGKKRLTLTFRYDEKASPTLLESLRSESTDSWYSSEEEMQGKGFVRVEGANVRELVDLDAWDRRPSGLARIAPAIPRRQ